MDANEIDRLRACEAAMNLLWAFATRMVERHGENGDNSMTDADHAEWQEAGAAANAASSR